MEADAAATGCPFTRSEHICRLHHQVRGIRPNLCQSAQIEKHRVTQAYCCFHGHVIEGLAKAARELAASSFKCANDLRQRWVAKNQQVFKATGKLVEKYDVVGNAAGGGGEYPLQDGFGWTNGVLRKLLAMYPKLAQ